MKTNPGLKAFGGLPSGLTSRNVKQTPNVQRRISAFRSSIFGVRRWAFACEEEWERLTSLVIMSTIRIRTRIPVTPGAYGVRYPFVI